MATQNQFLPFATGSGANVLTPAQYAALAALGPGFGTGVLPSNQLNSILRQSAFVAAMVGQFIANRSGNSALDDGNLTGFEGNFELALKLYILSQLGASATKGIGQGLKDDGSGNLTLKLADQSLRLTAAGLQANEPITSISAATSVVAASHFANFVASAALSLSLAQTTTLWNGFCFSVNAQGGTVTLTPNAGESINGMPAGRAYQVLQGASALFITDGAGNWYVLFQTLAPGSYYPRYLNAATTLGAGMYNVDTSAGAFPLTITTSPSNGDTMRFIDYAGTWGSNPPYLTPQGGATVMGQAANFYLNLPGYDVMFKYNATANDWRLQ